MSEHNALMNDCWASSRRGNVPSTPPYTDVFDEDTTLLKCLSDFMEPETLKDWMCERCGELQQVELISMCYLNDCN